MPRKPKVLIVGPEWMAQKIAYILGPTVRTTLVSLDVALKMEPRKLRSFDAIVYCYRPRVRAETRTRTGIDRIEMLARVINDFNRKLGGKKGRYLFYTYGVPVFERDISDSDGKPLSGSKSILRPEDLCVERLHSILSDAINRTTS